MTIEFKPFRGWRYNREIVGDTGKVIAPPYDVLTSDDLKFFMSASPYNITRLDAQHLDESGDPYQKAAESLEAWLREHAFIHDKKPSITLLCQEFPLEGKFYRRWGLIGLVRLHRFSEGKILPHERTYSKPKEDRFNLMTATRASFSQIFGLYTDPDRRVAAIASELMSTSADDTFRNRDGVVHRIWIITDPSVHRQLAEILSDKQIFIADGHHRYETALAIRDQARRHHDRAGTAMDYTMMYLVDMEDPELVVLPYHRLVKGVRELQEGIWPADVTLTPFSIPDSSRALGDLLKSLPTHPPAMIYYQGGGKGWTITFNQFEKKRPADPSGDPLETLGANLLHHIILPPLISGETGITITTTPFVEEVVAGIKKGGYQGAFLLQPADPAVIRAVSLAGKTMPQKSTYFYPKIPTGLVSYRFDAP